MDAFCTLNSAYNEKKYVEILLRYKWLFIKGNVFIGEWHVFGAEVLLCYSQFFIKGNFVIGGVECIYLQMLLLDIMAPHREALLLI